MSGLHGLWSWIVAGASWVGDAVSTAWRWTGALTPAQGAVLSTFAVGIGVILTIQQKRRADARAQWWARTQWAVELWYKGEPETKPLPMEMSLIALEKLGDRRGLGSRKDRKFLFHVVQPILEPWEEAYAADAASPPDVDDTGSDDDPRPSKGLVVAVVAAVMALRRLG